MLLSLPLLIVAQAGPLPGEAFPGFAVTETKDTGVVELFVEPALVQAMRDHDRVLLQGFPWDGGLDLEVERVTSPVLPGALHVDGRRTASLTRDVASFWSGRVAGETGSDVFLAFMPGASFGWVQRSDELVHLLTGPDLNGTGADGDWTKATTMLVSERALNETGRSFRGLCATETQPRRLVRRPTLDVTAGSTRTMRRGKLALETDYQFFQIFGNVAVAEAYVTALLTAANFRFRKQLNTDVRVNYIGFHTTPNDPWLTQDQPGAICFDTLYEFQAAWGFGGAPVAADFHMIMSGVDLSCGVAFLEGLCSPDESFSLMSRMDGLTSFPVSASPLNWDFVWTCHELGHNIGSVHSHEYCPPLDECSPAGYFGPCQDEMACTNQGTLMSYCHVCPGGMANFTTWYHPVAADVMRAAVEASCFRTVVVPLDGSSRLDLPSVNR